MLNLDDLVWVTLKDPENFLKIKETLTRIGVASKKDNSLFQSCHILHKKGNYAIIHFKELFALDGKKTDFSEDDKARRNTIANLLAEWDLITLNDPEKTKTPVVAMNQIKIISYSDKKNWTLVSKYSIGKKSN
jgi:hypothetical protein